jgi:hypothetical protein
MARCRRELGRLFRGYRQADYREWLVEAGFTSIDIVPTSAPAAVVFAG